MTDVCPGVWMSLLSADGSSPLWSLASQQKPEALLSLLVDAVSRRIREL